MTKGKTLVIYQCAVYVLIVHISLHCMHMACVCVKESMYKPSYFLLGRVRCLITCLSSVREEAEKVEEVKQEKKMEKEEEVNEEEKVEKVKEKEGEKRMEKEMALKELEEEMEMKEVEEEMELKEVEEEMELKEVEM